MPRPMRRYRNEIIAEPKKSRFVAFTPAKGMKVSFVATSLTEAAEIASLNGLVHARLAVGGERPGSQTATLAQWQQAQARVAA